MTTDTMKKIACYLKNNNENDMKKNWMYLGEIGGFRTSAIDTIRLCKFLTEKELFEYPLWLQNDVIRLLIKESDLNRREEIEYKLQSGEIFCLALTEQLGGSSFQNVRTKVMNCDINNEKAEGEKLYISNGSIADNIIFLARDSKEKLNLFYTNDLSNMIREKIMLSDAMRRYDLAKVFFANTSCECLYDNDFKAMFALNKAMSIERLFCSITMLAMAKNLLAFFRNIVKVKKEMIQDSQHWKFLYAQMKIKLHLLETYVSGLEEKYIKGKAIIPSDAAIAKSYAVDTLKFILEKVEILLGAQNILKDNILAPYEIYSKAYYSAGGTNEIMKEIIGADL